jgi:hypothetical protein
MRDSAPRGEGERRDAARRRTRWLIIAALFVAGIIPGFYLGYQDGAALTEGRTATWPPALVAALIGLYLFAVVGGGVLLNRVADDFDRQLGYKTVSFAGTVLMVVYPIWYVLWRGDLAPEPIHWVLFLLFWLSLVLAYLFYRFR